LEDTLQWAEEIFEKIKNTPVLWEYFLQIAEWKDVDIPEIIKKNLEKWLNSVSKTEKAETVMVSIPETKKETKTPFQWGQKANIFNNNPL
jgi:hypothetical protein